MIQFDQPNASRHAQLSFVKSFFRILAGLSLMVAQGIIFAGLLFIIAEIIGVAEELV